MTRGSIDRRAVFAGTVPPVTPVTEQRRWPMRRGPAVPLEASERTGTFLYSPALGVRASPMLDARPPTSSSPGRGRLRLCLAVFVLMVLESACIPIPSEVTMLFGGALASAAFAAAGSELTLFWVGMAGTLGNLVGSWLAYWAGAYGGRPAGRPVRPIPVDPAPRGRPGPRLVRAARGCGRVLLPAAPGGPDVHLGAGRGGPRCPSGDSPSTRCWDACHGALALAWFGDGAGRSWEAWPRTATGFAWAIAGLCILVAAVIIVKRRWKSVRAEYAALDAARRPPRHPRTAPRSRTEPRLTRG